MIIKHKITTDFVNLENMADNRGSGKLPQLHMVQGDLLSRAVELNVKVDGEDWDASVVENVFVHYRKPDGTGGSYDTLPNDVTAWSAEGSTITVRIAPQMLTVPGVVTAQVMAVSQGAGIATFHFQIVVEEDVSLGVVESEDYINWAAWAGLELDERLQQAQQSGMFDGATFTPSVSEDGVLSWTNDQERDNPADVDIIQTLVTELGLTGDTFAPGDYGIGKESGKMVAFADLDSAVKGGFYTVSDGGTLNNVAFGSARMLVLPMGTNAATQMLFPHGFNTVLMRSLADGDWSEWECSAPPMEVGTEYRTTERWKGKAVYTTVVDCGEILSTEYKQVATNVTGVDDCIAWGGCSASRNTIPYHSPQYGNYCRGVVFVYGSTNKLYIQIAANYGEAAPVLLWLKYTKL